MKIFNSPKLKVSFSQQNLLFSLKIKNNLVNTIISILSLSFAKIIKIIEFWYQNLFATNGIINYYNYFFSLLFLIEMNYQNNYILIKIV